MEQIKLIAIDLDDTLLNSCSTVSEENLRAISELKNKNVFFVPCSGRSLGEMPKSIVDNNDIRYIIHSNGSNVLDKLTGKTISASICKKTTSKIFDAVSKFQAHLTIRANGNCYIKTNTDDNYHSKFYNLCDSHVNAITHYAIKKDNFDEWKYSVENIDVVAVFFHDENERQKCREILLKEDDLLIVSVAPFNLEIISKHAGKGNGILSLSKKLNVNAKNIAGVGDSGNDIPMMQVVGLRLAVSNATDQLKNICDKVICSNDEHAVDYILKNFIDTN